MVEYFNRFRETSVKGGNTLNPKDINAIIKFYEDTNLENTEGRIYANIETTIRSLKDTCDRGYVNLDASIDEKIEKIHYWYSHFPKISFIYKSFKANDINMLHNTLYQSACFKQNAIPHWGTTPNLIFFHRIMSLFAACKTDTINLLAPEEWGVDDKNAKWLNLFMAIWYDREDWKAKVKEDGEKHLSKKLTKLDSSITKYLLALLEKDVNSANEALNLVCKGVLVANDSSINKFDRLFSILAHALYNLSFFVYNGELSGKILMPEQKNFYKELAIFQQDRGLTCGDFVYLYEKPFELLNDIMMATPPKLVRVKRGRDYLIDHDSFVESFTKSVKLQAENI